MKILITSICLLLISCSTTSTHIQDIKHVCGMNFSQYIELPIITFTHCLINHGIPKEKINNGLYKGKFSIVFFTRDNRLINNTTYNFNLSNSKTIKIFNTCSYANQAVSEKAIQDNLGPEAYKACLNKTKGASIKIQGAAFPITYTGVMTSAESTNMPIKAIPISGTFDKIQ